ncbi:MAG: S-layer homology domain-containing protein [Bacillota bacterium]
MDAGNYYVIVKLTEPAAEGEEPIVSAEAIPFTVYEDANAYVKAALDRLLHYYFLEQGSFTFNQKNSKDVWEYGGLLAEGNGSTDGRSWETIALTALGTAYPFDDNPEYGLPFQTENAAVKDEPDGMISFAIDGPVLSHQDGRNRRDYFNSLPIYSDETPNAKSLFRIAVSGVAAGCDPREKNLINELIRCGYVDYDIKKGELNYRNDGTLIIPPDGFALSYTLLTLEICHATVEEGFTKEYRNAGARTLLKAIKDFNETPLKPGSGGTSGDTIGMIYLPAPWLAEDELVDAEIRADLKAELAKLNDNVKNNLYRNGGVGWFSADRVAAGEYAQNVNSMGVLFNMMVLNGATAEDIGSWQAEDGTLLTALVGGQDVNKGIFGFNGAVDNWLATYQPLGALVDLYNGRNFYEYAQDTYDETYPQYTKRGDELLKQMRALPETVSSVDTIIAVNAAREAYHDFTSHLPEKADPEKIAAYYLNAADLNALEASAVEFVHYLIDELPADDLQTTADHEAVAYAREAFNTLSKDGQNSLGRENRDKLERAEKNIDKFAAAEAARLILALPDADGVVAADAGDILAARAAYNGLSEQQRKLVDGKTAAKLVSAERALEQLGAAAVKAAVAAIPGMSDLSLDDAAFVEEVRAAYDALSDVQKLAVTNIADLIKAETKLQKLAKTAAADQAAASAVADAIADLGKAENIGAADENEVKAARKAYSKLTDAQKALVANEEDLIAAEKAVDSAKKAAAQTAADEAAADRAEKAIAAIGEVTPGSEKAIANAREIYDALSDEQKSLVENGDVLMAAESEWAELTDEAEQAKTEAEAAAKAMADQKAADQAVSAIEAIGEVTLGSEKAIAKARAAYDGLSDDQKELVENAADLETAEEALAQLKTDTAAANAVRDLIDRLSDGDEITLADAKEAAAARKAFSRLSDAQKALVDNEDVLKAAEEAIGDLKAADAVEKAIDAVGEVTINSEEAIKAARAAYDALTDVQKDRVRNAAALTDAEKRWAELTGQRFVDVTQGMYCFDAVRWAVENGVTLGTDENHFSPDSACTRGQVVTFLWRAAGSPEVIAEHSFVDVAAGSYYEKAVLWAAAEEITEGTSDTTFSPNNPCTRGQVATFLWRAKGQPAAAVNSANPFTDVLPGSYYETAVLWAAANGVTNGIGENRFAPNDPCTRGQVVTFLFRAK